MSCWKLHMLEVSHQVLEVGGVSSIANRKARMPWLSSFCSSLNTPRVLLTENKSKEDCAEERGRTEFSACQGEETLECQHSVVSGSHTSNHLRGSLFSVPMVYLIPRKRLRIHSPFHVTLAVAPLAEPLPWDTEESPVTLGCPWL